MSPKTVRQKKNQHKPIGHRRHFLLLEVLIAFSIVVMAILPLLYPHYYIYQQQRAFIDKVNLDIAVGQIYSKILERLYRNEISWSEIEQKRILPIDASLLSESSFSDRFPYTGSFTFETIKRKKNDNFALNLVQITLTFIPKESKSDTGKSFSYTYDVFIAQQLKPPEPTQNDNKDTKQEGKQEGQQAASPDKGKP